MDIQSTDSADSAVAVSQATRTCRVQVRKQADPAKYIDGGWWPRSQDLASELPALCSALGDQLGRVALVGYRRTAWDVAPAFLDLQGHVVRLESLESKDSETLLVVGENGKNLTLLIVAPQATDTAAGRALADASSAGSGDVAAETEARSLAELATRLARHEQSGDEGRDALIRRWVDEAAAQSTAAPVQSYVPILVEHIVRGRMHATAAKPF